MHVTLRWEFHCAHSTYTHEYDVKYYENVYGKFSKECATEMVRGRMSNRTEYALGKGRKNEIEERGGIKHVKKCKNAWKRL